MCAIQLTSSDALVVVDVQNDFLAGGSLAVPSGDEAVPVLNRYIALFVGASLPVYATRDWHPANHCSFKTFGGIWPPHCIAGSRGAEFAAALDLPRNAVVVSKAVEAGKDAYSGFQGTDLANRLRSDRRERLFVGGLATDYCVLNTVIDALAQGFKVNLLADAIRAVDLHAGDGEAAIRQMTGRGAGVITLADIEERTSAAATPTHGPVS